MKCFRKIIAILLAAVLLASTVAGGISIICLGGTGLYSRTADEVYSDQVTNKCHTFAINLAHRYASLNLGNIPEAYLEEYFGTNWWHDSFKEGTFFYTIASAGGNIVESTLPENADYQDKYEIELTNIRFRQLVTETPADSQGETIPEGTVSVEDVRISNTEAPEETLPDSKTATTPTESPTEEPQQQAVPETTAAGIPETTEATAEAEVAMDNASQEIATFTEATEKIILADQALYSDGYWDYDNETYVEVNFRYATLNRCTVTVYLKDGALNQEPYWNVLRLLYSYRYDIIWATGISLALFALVMSLACHTAGWKKDGTLQLTGLSRGPLDLYLVIAVGLCVLLAVPIVWLYEDFYYYGKTLESIALTLGLCGACLFLMALVVVMFLFILSAQLKMKKGLWWRRSLCGGLLVRAVRGVRWLGRGCKLVFSMLPMVVRWLLITAAMAGSMVLSFVLAMVSHGGGTVFWLLVFGVCLLSSIAIICYGAYGFGTLLEGTRKMARGDLNQKISTAHLHGSHYDFADELNSLAEGAKIAAEKQMRSERMKTELITNVSHDIKTPLTSIINYVDLLKGASCDEERQLYLEVLDRQSLRLKKLIDDLMDMSKASSGAMSVELYQVDAVEAINQSLGEFADKLDAAGLIPVFRHPEEPVLMNADGRLVWRVMSNLLVTAKKVSVIY